MRALRPKKETMKILGIAGSLRKESYNRGLLRAALEVVPKGCHLEVFDLSGIPVYNEEDEVRIPERVVQFKKAIRASDAILIATPEYNYSIPGILKNAIDWASRPYGDSAWDGKPVAIVGASPAIQGTARAQYHLRQTFVYLNMYPLNKPELMVGVAQDKFDAQGNLLDAEVRERIGELMEALVSHAQLFMR